MSERLPSATAPETEWTPWKGISADPLGLARFVSDRVPESLLCERHREGQDRTEVARAAFEALSALRLPYLLPSMTPRGEQWVRDPQWFSEESGTCIDAAVAYASMLRYAHLHPSVIVLEGRGWAHALVGVHGRDASRRIPSHAEPVTVLSGGEPGNAYEQLTRRLPVIVDVIAALEGRDRDDWGPATGDRVRRWLEQVDADGGTIHAIDVAAAHRDGVREARWRTGDDRSRPAVSLRLRPPRVALHPRGQEIADSPLTVLAGPQGTGKSVLAQQLVARPGWSRYGWVLTASDAITLSRSLAASVLRESGRPSELLASDVELQEAAKEGLDRLRRRWPWTVIIDNADCDPDVLRAWLPLPQVEYDQRLVITTAHGFTDGSSASRAWEQWSRAHGAVYEEVGPLTTQELEEWFPAAASIDRELHGGRILFAAAFQAATDHGIHIVPSRPESAGDGHPAAVAFWESVRSRENGLAAASIATAQRLAWLQPDAIPATTIDARERFELVDVGLLQDGDDTVSMHRLFGAVVRDTGGAIDALCDERCADDLRDRAQTPELAALRGALQDEAPSDRWCAAAATLIDVHEQRGFAATPESDEFCEHVVRCLTDVSPTDGTHAQRATKATALHGRARVRNHQSGTPGGRERVPEGLGHVEEAIELRRSLDQLAEDEREALVLASEALYWLLRSAGELPPDEKRAAVTEALGELRRITDAREARDRRLGTRSHDTARSYVNTAGKLVNLAQLDLAHAGEHLDQAEKDYGRALAIRRELFRVVPGGFEAATHFGVALVNYYRAILHPLDATTRAPAGLAGTIPERTARLQEAARSNERGGSIRDRSSSEADSSDSCKHVDLGLKIALARRTLGGAPPPAAALPPALDLAHRRASRFATTREAMAEIDQRTQLTVVSTEAPWLRAVVTTRHGGVSTGAYSSLNLGDHVGDDPDAVATNRRLVCDALGVERLTIPNQTHGNGVAIIDAELSGTGHDGDHDARARLADIDAMITAETGAALTILVADCIPILLYDPEVHAFGVVHAGRGGIVADVIKAAVDRLEESFGASPNRMRAHLGPHIALTSYEVGQDELDEYVALFPDAPTAEVQAPVPRCGGAGSIDLGKAATLRLTGAGLLPWNITVAGIDTYTSSDHFSHRRQTHEPDGPAATGRFALVAWMP